MDLLSTFWESLLMGYNFNFSSCTQPEPNLETKSRGVRVKYVKWRSAGRRDSAGADERALLMTSTFMASYFINSQASQYRLFPAPSQTSRHKHPFPVIQYLFNWPPARPEHRWNMEQSRFRQDICGSSWCKLLQLTSEDHDNAQSPSPENQKTNEKHFWKHFGSISLFKKGEKETENSKINCKSIYWLVATPNIWDFTPKKKSKRSHNLQWSKKVQAFAVEPRAPLPQIRLRK